MCARWQGELSPVGEPRVTTLCTTMRTLFERYPFLRSAFLPRAAFLVYLAAIAVFAWVRPYYNWDLLGYVGAALSVDDPDPIRVHEQTYALVRSAAPDSTFALLSSQTDPYRRLMAADPASFQHQLRLYAIRPLYVASLVLIRRWGWPIVEASRALSIVPVLVSAILILLWLERTSSRWTATAAAILITSAARLPDLARLSTPDALAEMFVLTGSLLFLDGKHRLVACSTLWLSIVTRTDCAVFVLALLLFARMVPPPGRPLTGLSLLLFALVVTTTAGVIHALIGHSLWEGMPYWRGLLASIRQLFLNDLFTVLPYFLGLGIVTLAIGSAQHAGTTRPVQITLIALSSIGARIALFPHLADRFFPVEYLLLGVAFFHVQHEVIRTPAGSTASPHTHTRS